MGRYAGKLLGLELPQTKKQLYVLSETDGCFADGVSVATGCWMGRRTMRLLDEGKVAATFVDTADSRAIRIRPSLRSRVLASRYAPGAQSRWHAYLEAYQVMPDDELLEVRPATLTIDLEGLISRPGGPRRVRRVRRGDHQRVLPWLAVALFLQHRAQFNRCLQKFSGSNLGISYGRRVRQALGPFRATPHEIAQLGCLGDISHACRAASPILIISAAGRTAQLDIADAEQTLQQPLPQAYLLHYGVAHRHIVRAYPALMQAQVLLADHHPGIPVPGPDPDQREEQLGHEGDHAQRGNKHVQCVGHKCKDQLLKPGAPLQGTLKWP
jgi:hypothetical protein